jgi:hypothetical protein
MGTETVSVYESVARNLGDIETKGTPTGCTATTLDCNKLLQPLMETLRGKEVYIYTGVGAGQARVVASYDPANHRIIVDEKWDTIPTTSSKFLIFQHFYTEDYESALNRSIGIAKMKYLEDKVATLQLVASQYEYPVPSGVEWISTLRLVPSGHTHYSNVDRVNRIFEIPPRDFRIERSPLGTYLIIIDPRKINLDSFDEDYIHVIGQAKADFTGTTIPSDVEEFVIAHSSMLLAGQKVHQNRDWERLFFMYSDIVKGRGNNVGLEEYIYRYGRGKHVG